MCVGDVSAVASIEAVSVSSWTAEQVASELLRPMGLALVAVAVNGQVAAWCCAFQTESDAELLKMTVSPKMRRRGLASALMDALCLIFTERNVEQIFLEVRSRNCPALKLYEQHSFKEVGKRKKYYKEPADDALIYVRLLKNNENE